MQPADIAVSLRRRTPWEATDLGLAMLQRWWRPVYAAHAMVLGPIAALLVFLGWAYDAMWAAVLAMWWLEPLYDRAVLHVLSRAVFGEVPEPRSVLRSWREWAAGLPGALSFDRFDLARTFNLPVRQLEGQRGTEARKRRSVLGRRARSYAVWLTVVWVHFEWVLVLSAGALTDLVLPAELERARGAAQPFFGNMFEVLKLVSASNALVWAAVLFFLEPFFVATGFALYLNRRTLLEGWDIEVALRRIAKRHGAALIFVVVAAFAAFPAASVAQEKNPKQELAEVMKAPEFGHYRDTMTWERRDPSGSDASWFWEWLFGRARSADGSSARGIGYALAKAAEVLFWGIAIAALAYALWWILQRLPRVIGPPHEAYRPPPALFGMELAPQTLPPDVAQAAAALAREGRLREALSLLYRGALSELVHKRGVQLLPGHTEGEAVRLAGMPYFASLVDAWRRCAYAKRLPSASEIEALADTYRTAFA